MLASASGAFLAYLTTWRKFRRPDLSMAVNGMLAGLVAITAPCAFVTAPSAILIGAVAGVLVVYAALFIENTPEDRRPGRRHRRPRRQRRVGV